MISLLAKAASFGFARVLFRNRTTTAISALLIVLGLLFAWHQIDKRSAVRQAVLEYVADTEIKVLQAQIEEANRRAAIASEAQDRLEQRLQVAESKARRIALEIKQYEAENEINPDGVVDSGLLLRLRGN